MAAITSESTFFANKGIITVESQSGNPTVLTLAVVKDVEVTTSFEHVPLYGWGSISRVAVAKHTAKVAVKIGWMKFAPAVTGSGASPWFPFWILNPTAGTGTVSDTNTVKLFKVIVKFQNENGDYLVATVDNVYFPNFPLKMTEGQWMKVDLTGEGSAVTFTNT
jgi:hypothetical protein